MSHLLDYEEAVGDLEKALAALVVSDRKKNVGFAWDWAKIAAEHAENAGVEDAYDFLGCSRRPETEPLRCELMKLAAAESEESGPETVTWLEAGRRMAAWLRDGGFFEGPSPEELARQDEAAKRVRAALEAREPYTLYINSGQSAYHYALVGVETDRVPLPIVLRWFGHSGNTVWFADADVIRVIGYKWEKEKERK